MKKLTGKYLSIFRIDFFTDSEMGIKSVSVQQVKNIFKL
jgi:hypothetical protein